jgi:hypothetical protein
MPPPGPGDGVLAGSADGLVVDPPIPGSEPAPTTCPCTEVDPAEWPCGGLLETYTITEWQYDYDHGDTVRIWRLKSPAVVYNVNNSVCLWSVNSVDGDIEYSLDGGATWADVTGAGYYFSIGLSSSLGWEVSCQLGTGSIFVEVHKSTGQTPLGFYSEEVRYNGGVTGRRVTATVS